MADPETTSEVLQRINIDKLDPEWVKHVWEQDFTEHEELTGDVLEDLEAKQFYCHQLKDVREVLLPWAQGLEAVTGEGFWMVLVENEMSYKNLITLLYYIIDHGSKRMATAVDKLAGIAAADTYFVLISIPGSGAFKVFHPVLFEKCIDFLKSWVTLGAPAPANKKRKQKSPVPASQGSRRNKSRRTTARRTQVEEDEEYDPFADDDDEEEEDEGEGPAEISYAELNKLSTALTTLLKDFVLLLKNYCLKKAGDAVPQAMQVLTQLSKLHPETFDGQYSTDTNLKFVNCIPQLAYMGMSFLCALHGDATTMITAMFKHLLPGILMHINDNKAIAAATIPRHYLVIRDQVVQYVCHLMKEHKGAVLPAVRILLQHMCVKVADKTEYRTKVSQAIVTIMSKLPSTTYARMIEWIYKYSRNSKIGYRVFALDLIALLMNEQEREIPVDFPPELAPFLKHEMLVQMMLSRCSDIAPTVRARAIQGFAQCSESTEPVVRNTVKRIMTPCAHNRPPMSRIIPTPDPNRVVPVIQQEATNTTKKKKVPTATLR